MEDFHRKALVDAFFHRQDEVLLSHLRQQVEHEDEIAQMAGALGFEDEETLEDLYQAGLDHETVIALTLMPLVQVAWADGFPSVKDRAAVLDAVHEAGVCEGTPCHRMIQEWLHHRPDDRLWRDWCVYAKSIYGKISPDSRESLKTQTLARAKRVASASGGIPGLRSPISRAEQAVLQEVELVLA